MKKDDLFMKKLLESWGIPTDDIESVTVQIISLDRKTALVSIERKVTGERFEEVCKYLEKEKPEFYESLV